MRRYRWPPEGGLSPAAARSADRAGLRVEGARPLPTGPPLAIFCCIEWRTGRLAKRPGIIEPWIPTRVSKPPVGPQWIHEIKHDGYRPIARKRRLARAYLANFTLRAPSRKEAATCVEWVRSTSQSGPAGQRPLLPGWAN
jgi:hypothetical protein